MTRDDVEVNTMLQMTLLNAFSEFFFFMLYYKTTKKEKSKLLLFIFGFVVSCFHSFVLYPLYYRYHFGLFLLVQLSV